MKLIDLYEKIEDRYVEGDDILRIKTLIVDVSAGVNEHVFIITDVPSITKDKFHKLMKTSFPSGMSCSDDYTGCVLNNYASINILDLDDDTIDWDGGMDVATSTWKEFVEWAIKQFPNVSDDDFDE